MDDGQQKESDGKLQNRDGEYEKENDIDRAVDKDWEAKEKAEEVHEKGHDCRKDEASDDPRYPVGCVRAAY